MKKISLNWTVLIGGLIMALVNTGCLDNQYEEDEQEAKDKLKTYIESHGFTESNNIGSDIYLKFYNDTSATKGAKPIKGQTIIVSFTGKLTDGTIFECTDSATGVKLFESNYFVYGPSRIKLGNLIKGMDSALVHFNIGDSATVVIPHAFAYYNYEPVVYDIKLLDIIEDDTINASDMFMKFKEIHSFSADSLFDNVLYKGHPSYYDSISSGDSVKVRIVARFAEDYYSSHLGRVFFPLNTAKEEITWVYGDDEAFPVRPVIEKALKYMKQKDTLEILCPYTSAYGTTGFYNPYTYVNIVPPFMPVHYRLILTDIIKED